MFLILAQLIGLLSNALTILVFIWAILSWVLPPYNPWREALDRIMEPMMRPFRRLIPAMGGIDFTPMIFIIVVWLGTRILTSLLLSL
jgi:YggT family protein